MTTLQRYHIIYKEVANNTWSVCTSENNGNLIMTPLWMLDEERILNLPHFTIPIINEFGFKRATADDVLKKFKDLKCEK